MTVASLVISVASAIAAIGSALWARASIKQAKVANGVAVIAEFLKEFRETAADRTFILDELPRRDVSGGLPRLAEQDRDRVLRVSHYLDNLGLMVERDLVDQTAVAGFIGESIVRLWNALSPLIEAERVRRGESYQAYFEHLAATVRDLDPPKVRRRLRRFPAVL